jgi:ribonucleoside-triphosphate reductase (thioredoxin)
MLFEAMEKENVHPQSTFPTPSKAMKKVAPTAAPVAPKSSPLTSSVEEEELPSCYPRDSQFYGGLLGPQLPEEERFVLNPALVEEYRHKQPPFGFNGLGEVVYLRTYARDKDNGQSEVWVDTVERVVKGVFEILQHHVVNKLHCTWDAQKAQERSEDMFRRIFDMKFLPPGRGLWAMGAPVITKKGFAAALNNCAFVSTANLHKNRVHPFTFLMDASMLGVGVGFDTAGAGSFIIPGPDASKTTCTFVVPDKREGWVESLKRLLQAHFYGMPNVEFDYSKIREMGQKLKTFGGTSSGPGPLINLHKTVRKMLEGDQGKPISVTHIADIMNMIGVCTVAGNIRRSAEIAFGEADCKEFLDLKSYETNPQRQEYGWASNNSIFARIGMDYSDACERVRANGEPGFAWLSNMQAFSRMDGKPDHRDQRVSGGNPCLEQSLESMELCCLVETFPDKHDDLEDFKRTLYSAFLFAKTVTLLPLHWRESNEIMMRNRRIGCSVSGIAQFITNRGLNELKNWLEQGYDMLHEYDKQISEWLCIRQSIKLTSVKPSGTISLVAGATPGVHYPESCYYTRRLRMARDSPLLERIVRAGYHVEPCAVAPDTTAIVEFPVAAGNRIRTTRDVSMWEQLSLAAFMQRYWADNQVSATVTFDPETEGPQLAQALQFFQYQLKGISFLPRFSSGTPFKQMPYEAITEEEYFEALRRVRPEVSLSSGETKSEIIKENLQTFCDNDRCIRL